MHADVEVFRPSLAKRLLYCCETLDAGAACGIGLLDEVVVVDSLNYRVQTLANCIASQPRNSIQTMARLVDRDFSTQFRTHIQYGVCGLGD